MKKFHYLNNRTLSIPFSIPLTKESSWNCLDVKKTRFFIARLHFVVRERIVEQVTRKGPQLSVFTFPEGMEFTKFTSLEFEHEETKCIESIEKSLLESEIVQAFASNLMDVSLKAPGFQLGSSSDLSFTENFRTSFSNEFRMSQSIKETRKIRIEDTISFDKNYSKKTYLVPEYQKYAFDVWLSYVDYLYVTYEKSYFGLRKKRKKYPLHQSIDRRPNVIKLNDPLVTIEFWKKIGGYSFYGEENYKMEVKDVNTFKVKNLENRAKHYVSFPRIPSLYQVSQVAFPLKWIKRMGNWTEEELMAIEENDARETAWWYMYGPGKNDL